MTTPNGSDGRDPAVPYLADFRERLRSGRFLLGTWQLFLDSTATEAIAGSGFDFIIADGEHGPIATTDLLAILVAARASGLPILYRVAANEPVRIMHALDSGAAGVVVPQIRSVADARRATDWTRYPPAGLRGIAPRRVSDYGRRADEYLATANERVTCCIQIETREALEALDGILAVPNVDCLLVGPNDFAASLGHTGDIGHPDVEAAIARVLAAARAAGTPCGIWTPSVEVARRRRAEGFAFATVGADYTFLVAAADAAVQAVREP